LEENNKKNYSTTSATQLFSDKSTIAKALSYIHVDMAMYCVWDSRLKEKNKKQMMNLLRMASLELSADLSVLARCQLGLK